MKLRNTLILLVLIIFQCGLFAQKLYEKVFYTVPEEYVRENLKYQNLFVDSSGNFCMEIRIDGKEYFYKNDTLIASPKYISTRNNFSFTSDGIDSTEEEFWYRCDYSVNVYGPLSGKYVQSSESIYGDISLILKRGDSVFYYVNGKKIYDFKTIFDYNVFGDDWCRFNEKGDYLLLVDNGPNNILLLNGTVIDSAIYIGDINLDKYGNYVYLKSDRGRDNASVVKMCYNNQVLYEGKSFTNAYMDYNGSFYFYNSHLGERKILFKNKIFEYPRCVDAEGNSINDIKVKRGDAECYLFCCIESINRMNVYYNGIDLGTYQKVNCLNIDSIGNYAFFAVKDYYLYPVINGIHGSPLSKYGVRAKPLYISPDGKKYVYYKTKDSIYVYFNDELLKTMSSDKSIYTDELYRLFNDYKASDYIESTSIYIRLDNESYYIINDKVYGPFLPVSDYYNGIGSVEEAKIYDNGEFFLIQQQNKRSYNLIYNGVQYSEITNVDGVLENCFYKDDKGFTFYAVNGNTIYQYSTYER